VRIGSAGQPSSLGSEGFCVVSVTELLSESERDKREGDSESFSFLCTRASLTTSGHQCVYSFCTPGRL